MIKTETSFHGDKILGFKSVELQAFLTCFVCGERRGPFAIKKPPFPQEPIFGFQEDDQLGRDAKLLRAVLAGDPDKDDPVVEWTCPVCVLEHGFQILDEGE